MTYWLLAIPLARHLAFTRGWGLQGLWVGAASANTVQVRVCPGFLPVATQCRRWSYQALPEGQGNEGMRPFVHCYRAESNHLTLPCRPSSWRHWPCGLIMLERRPRRPRATL